MLRHDSHRPQSQHKHHGLADSAPHHTAKEMKEGERSMLPHSCSIATPSPPESVFSDSTDQIAGVINVGGNGGNARRTAERYCGGEVSPLGSIDYHGRSSSPSPIAVSVGSKTIGTTVMHGPVTNEIISPDNLIPPQHPNYQIVVERAAFTTIIADA